MVKRAAKKAWVTRKRRYGYSGRRTYWDLNYGLIFGTPRKRRRKIGL